MTSPANGAAEVIAAPRRCYRDHCLGATEEGRRDLLRVAAVIGGLIEGTATTSGAESDCREEVGSASAMATTGFRTAFGGAKGQVEDTSKIAREHHLGTI